MGWSHRNFLLTMCQVVLSADLALAQLNHRTVHAYQANSFSEQFVLCEASYSESACKADSDIIRDRLRGYPLHLLGPWTWVLVPSSQWQTTITGLGLSPETPAFTSLTDRITLLEQALISPDARRGAELIRTFGLSRSDLLDLAISHELGHGLCGFRDEDKANDAGERLRNHETPYCGGGRKRNVKVAFGKFPDVIGGQ